MSDKLKKFADFFKELGIAQIDHSENTYLSHALGVYRDLKSWECSEELCDAGMFHSIYGTEMFQKFALPLARRGEVRELIGQRAERLAYLNCSLVRSSLDSSLKKAQLIYTLEDRFLQQETKVSEEDYNDLCRIHLCDWLETVGRTKKWHVRSDAFRRMAERLGGVAQQSYKQVFSQAPRVN